MIPAEPFMLLRARADEESRERFDRWFLDTHLADVRRIPGVVDVLTGRTESGARLGVYAFETSDSVQSALQSPQAAFARGAFEQWMPHLDQFTLEIFAPLFLMPIFRSLS